MEANVDMVLPFQIPIIDNHHLQEVLYLSVKLKLLTSLAPVVLGLVLQALGPLACSP